MKTKEQIEKIAKKLLKEHPNGCTVGQLIEAGGQDCASDVLTMIQYLIEQNKWLNKHIEAQTEQREIMEQITSPATPAELQELAESEGWDS